MTEAYAAFFYLHNFNKTAVGENVPAFVSYNKCSQTTRHESLGTFYDFEVWT